MSVVSTIVGDVEACIKQAHTVSETVSAVSSAFPDIIARGTDVIARIAAIRANPLTIAEEGAGIETDLATIIADVKALAAKL